ncbi:MAG: hypothetical protein JWR51_2685 [Devosia sp.]|uniref:hypothetical protein n=1 Tax=Devosia sp. TaxID=1871048 RepID=UPI002619FDF1|nr:hypothetical protein [Devosia sp.]MDB5529582.1 hypothetical protein [Devosia sp.]
MRLSHLALAVCLFVLPIAGAATFPALAAVKVSELGDLSAMHTIVADTQALVASNDLAGAKARITEFETAWDNVANDLRAKNAQKWDAIDAASDVALEAVRADSPAATSDAALTALLAQLDNPGATNAAGVVTTDTSGKPLPCEDMLAQYRAVQPKAASLDDATKAKVADLEAKGLERCNADDDKRADDFFGQAIQLIGA